MGRKKKDFDVDYDDESFYESAGEEIRGNLIDIAENVGKVIGAGLVDGLFSLFGGNDDD